MAEVEIVTYEKTEDIERNEKYHMDNMRYTNEKSEYEKFSTGAVYHERNPQNEKKSRAIKTWIVAFFLALVALAAVAVALAIVVSNNKDNSEGTSSNVGAEIGRNIQAPTSQAVCTTEACVQAASRLIESIDPTADPCDDFFQFACGTWRKKNVIPEHKPKIGVFYQAGDNLDIILKYILSNPVQPSDIDAVVKAKTFYHSCLNEGTSRQDVIDINGVVLSGFVRLVLLPVRKEVISSEVPLQNTQMQKYTEGTNKTTYFKRRTELIEKMNLISAQTIFTLFGGWPVLETAEGGNWREANYNIESLLIKNRQYSNSTPIFVIFVYDDAKNPDKNILYLDQPLRWGLPSREYYLRGRNDVALRAYENLAVHMAVAFGANPTTANVDVKNMVDFEIKLAKLSMPEVERIDQEKLYHKYTLDKLKSEASKFDWTKYLTETLSRDGININIAANETIIVRSPEYIKGVFNIVGNTPSRTVQNYVVWRYLAMECFMTALPRKFGNIFNAYEKMLLGSSTPPSPRWKTCVSNTNSVFGEAVGKLFLKEAFDETARENALVMINNLKTAMKGLLDENDWMDKSTKVVAKEKADFMEPRIGYQDKVLSDEYLNDKYKEHTVHAEKYMENLLDALKVASIESLRKLREPVDKTSWDTTPATVNAFYHSQRNQIIFPAGILQPPFYKKDYPKYINYGGIGYVIGHEITHGFDDKGRLFDKYGNLQQWWNDASIANFKSRAVCMINQYSNYTVEEANEKLNGILTLGENIADNGGLRESWRAYQEWIRTSNNGRQEPTLPGLKYTQKQLFFLSAAHVWCGVARPKEALRLIRTDIHSNFKSRVVGPLQNNDDFSDAFQCAKGTKMNPERKCIIW